MSRYETGPNQFDIQGVAPDAYAAAQPPELRPIGDSGAITAHDRPDADPPEVLWTPADLATRPMYGPRLRLEMAKLNGDLAYPFNNIAVGLTLVDVAEQLAPHLHKYDLVVGEDTSGRLPALLYRKLVNLRRGELGLPPAAMRFLSGRYDGTVPPPFPLESSASARTLLVTEWIQKGTSINNLYSWASMVRDPERTDIAALGRQTTFSPLQASGARFYVAEDTYGDNVDRHLSYIETLPQRGVYKVGGEPYARLLPFNVYSAAKLIRARQDVRRIAEKIYPLLPPPEL